MHKPLIIFQVIFFLVASSASHAEDSSDNEKCGFTQLEQNNCAAFKYHEADGELNRIYKEQLAALKTPKTIARFRDAQRAWVAFRDKTCLYEVGTREENGSSWIADDFVCKTYYTKLRIFELEKYLACREDYCPN
jgi:uncharacterized protein YecT (DUF1311 family)